MKASEERASTLHREVREELTKADSKATSLLGVNGLVLGVLAAGAIAGNWTPTDMKWWAESPFWVGLILVLGSEGLLLKAIFPRISHDLENGQAHYFGHVTGLSTRDDLAKVLEDANSPFDHHLDQIWVLSESANVKYVAIQRSIWGFSAGISIGIFAVFANQVLG